MSFYNPSQLYAQLTNVKDENQKENTKNTNEPTRQIDIKEFGEASLTPDIIRSTIICVNTKESLDQVKESVSRRIDYITQTLRNHQISGNQYKIHKLLSTTEEGNYKMVAEAVINFNDLKSYEKTINFLVEKLDKSIQICQPVFCHSPGKLANLRRQASLNAIENCRTKALSIAQLLHQTLGAPLYIHEEDTQEYTGGLCHSEIHHNNNNIKLQSLEELYEKHTKTIYVKVHAIFQCKERNKKK